MSTFSLSDLAKIIERDSKDATYKFALLRGTIDIIQNFPHYRSTDGKDISYPMGLMILKWIGYYYPLLAKPYFMCISMLFPGIPGMWKIPPVG